MEGNPEVILKTFFFFHNQTPIGGALRHGVAAVKISTQFSPWTSTLFNFFLHSQTGLNGDMATVTNSKSHVNKWKSGAAPTKIGRHTLHPKKPNIFTCTSVNLLFMCRNP
ncbi:hypothetical protein Bca52824_082122 [Brassica carinata]|uniref:Uncharacterized protein n=1 Tax=Brassica carinata TaxID=52824 RepID=A0A8X7TSJ6_BRACI|nr:hypothetical protein Bca52824_082122 [Brassica carinata]